MIMRRLVGKAGVLLSCAAAVLALAREPRETLAAEGLANAASTVRELASGGDWPPARVRPVLDVLDRETRRFVAMSPGADAARLGDDLIPVLSAVYDGLTARLDGMRNDVLERDGDLEGLLAAPAYRERETIALTALYHLSWARYQQSQTLPPASSTRRALLQQAVRGFTEFVYVNEIPQVYGDCLYGRALAFHALGQTQNATADLQAVVNLGPKHPSYARARAALDAVRSGKPIKAPAPPDPTASQLERLKTLLAAHGGAPAGSKLDAAALEKRAAAQNEALALARALAARGAGNAERVEGLVRETAKPEGAFVHVLRAEIARDRGDDGAARDRYAAAAAAADVDAARYHARASFGAAVATYRIGDYAEAAQAFADFTAAHPDVENTAAALYFRFKAIEAGRTGADAGGNPPAGAADDVYLDALRAYLERYPEGEHAPELRYRLAEFHHGHDDCTRALEAVATTTGTDVWSLWGRFVALQCQADRTRAAWRAGAADADALYRGTITSAGELATAADGADAADAKLLGARASLLGALVAVAAPQVRPDDAIALVGTFETRYPASPELFGDAIAVLAQARTLRGDIDGATADVDRLAALKDTDTGAHLRHVGQAAVGEADRADAERRPKLLSLARHVYRRLTAPGSNGTEVAEEADMAMLAQVSLQLGDLDAAAEAYGRLLKIEPDSLEGLRGLARTAEAGGRHAEAGAHWRRLLDHTSPGDTLWFEATIHAAHMDELQGNADQACAALRKAKAQAQFPASGELGTAHVELEQRVCR
jgi:tetratricopeptide (TPR) repeat protein